MDKDYLKGLLEEILYIWAEPIDINDLNSIIYDSNKKDISQALDEMIIERNNKKSGLILREFSGSYQLTSRKIHDKYFEKVIKRTEKKLTTSNLETLSIIAYKQPITRAEIDKIRGVNSQSTIDSLLNKGLIEENGRLDKIGKPIIYITSNYFLQYFNISSLEELPEIIYEEEGGEYEDQ